MTQAPPLHLAGVTLPDGDSRDLWVSGGLLTHEPVPDATTLPGGFLVPGLVDAHCHIGIDPSGPVPLADAARQAEIERDAGVLLIRDCGVPVDTRPLQRRDELPRIIRSGRHLARHRRYLRDLGWELEDPSELPAAVAAQVAEGDGWIKLVGDWIDREIGDLAPLWPDDVLAEAVAVAHRAGARVNAHVFGEDALPGLLAAGVDCIEHGTGLTDDTIEQMARQGTTLVPTLINTAEFLRIADSAGRFPRYAAHMRALHARRLPVVAAALEAGVPIFAGTDAGSSAGDGIGHGRIADEVLALAEAGLSNRQALGAASWAARDWLGHPNLIDGASADLVIYAEDPRVDLAVLRSPRDIVLRGRVHPGRGR
ncbi:amidohydrolase family protein [Actinoalloteichus hymeniacidonis]|uniref:Amidohydrolase, imidazolonepropionase n=1 Tax=Actinoalloteichus hymeniacidonis TaxID=340345 RepID=A0AAC9MXP7_9PSEU|nr:amidohydrolase family protein [Actinoalloteichus hymeniacidonis]AOS62564.1 amidohydrolase, imidazolonepropionase [Actinoalloteichus hymeniacidonis]MBB5909405.1 imidazolonepropionase-like amidohydrolase [Actinoalloteichus hymeniacidonis]